MRFTLITVVVAVLASAGLVTGQTPPTDSQVALPDGDGSWIIWITTSGGFTGQGRGNVTLTSQGQLTCFQSIAPCDTKLASDKLRPIAQLVSSLKLSEWVTAPPETAICNDCITTTVRLARREGGTVKNATVSWTEVTQGKVPADVVRLVEMALVGK